MRTLFFGTPDVAVPAFEALHEISDIQAVICQPDRPAGRGLKLRPPPIKSCAAGFGLDVVQPTKIRTKKFASWVRSHEADVAVVMAYGRILPPSLLEAPAKGCINIHASLLPLYRGAAPINWAIVHGETETGISLMQMDEGCDTGPVFSRWPLPIGPEQTAGQLADQLAQLAAEVIKKDLPRAVSGELVAQPQDDEGASAAPLIKKEDGCVDWTRTAQAVHNLVRGMTPWPGAHSWADGQRLKLLQTAVAEPTGQHGAPGTILVIGRTGAEIACGEGTVLLKQAQFPGKRPCSCSELAAGRCLAEGQRIGQLEDD